MQHPLHNDRPPFPAVSDDLRSSSPSGNIGSCSWAAATTSCSSSIDTCMHADSAASQDYGSFFRQLFSEDQGAMDGAASSPKQEMPHTLEFVSPATVSSCFHSTTMAQSGQLRDHQSSTVKQGRCEADGDHLHKSQIVVSSSCKKAKLFNQPAEQQCSIAGNDPSAQLQGILSKQQQQVQTARSKEKLGERINALQQLVSPFGKTDTASVLSEAIGYIKFLQEQVQVLSSPYMKPTTSTLICQDGGIESMSDLRSRGLCLVPVACTMNVANNNNINIGADYWASTASTVGGGGNTGPPRLSTSTCDHRLMRS